MVYTNLLRLKSTGWQNHLPVPALPEGLPFWKGAFMATARRHRSLPTRTNLKNPLIAAATGRAAKAAYVVIGAAGLAALAVAIFGPKRFQHKVLKPVQGAVSDQASQLWADSRALREQIGRLFARVQNQASREKLARGFQSWIGHFRAT
jgi:hypothetical protein